MATKKPKTKFPDWNFVLKVPKKTSNECAKSGAQRMFIHINSHKTHASAMEEKRFM